MRKLPTLRVVLFFLALAVHTFPSVVALPIVLTDIPVGSDSGQATNHGSSRLFCVVPAPWTSIVVFYLGNFAAHAATLVTYPGEAPMSILRAILFALFFPTSGITRGLDAIFRRARFETTDLEIARRAGALCHLVRTEHWRPPRWSEAQRYDSVTSNDGDGDGERPAPRRNWFVMSDGAWMKELPRFWPYFNTSLEMPNLNKKHHSGWEDILHTMFSTDRKLHGTVDLSRLGDKAKYYTLDYVPRNAKVESLEQGTVTTVASSYSLVKAVVALLQACYAVATLVKASGPQVEQYGYAAFGLTPAPYAIMSVINLLGNLVTPQYDALYLIESDILHEAREAGAIIDGQVGRLVVENPLELVDIEMEKISSPERRSVFTHVRTMTRRFTGSRQCSRQSSVDIEMHALPEGATADDDAAGPSAPAPSAPTSRITTETRRLDTKAVNRVAPNITIAFTSPRFERTDNIPRTKVDVVDAQLRCEARRTASSGSSSLVALNKWFFNRENRHETGIPWYSYLFFTAICLLVGSISLIVIGAVSKFEVNNSTHAQRVWISCWIVFGVVLGTLVAFFNAILEYRSRRGEGLNTYQKTVFLSFGLLLAPPAVGGFVVVGQMLREYGNCVTLPA